MDLISTIGVFVIELGCAAACVLHLGLPTTPPTQLTTTSLTWPPLPAPGVQVWVRAQVRVRR